jgi:hypothetical protein
MDRFQMETSIGRIATMPTTGFTLGDIPLTRIFDEFAKETNQPKQHKTAAQKRHTVSTLEIRSGQSLWRYRVGAGGDETNFFSAGIG